MAYIKKIQNEEYKEKIAIKNEKQGEEVAWVFPQALEKGEKRVELKKFNQILVKSTEQAVVYENEQIVRTLTNGIYDLDKKGGAENLKVVYLTKQDFDIKWGIPQQQGVLTSDNVKVGTSGTLSLSISAPEVFSLNIVKETTIVESIEVKRKINDILRGILRETVSQYTIEEIQKVGHEELEILVIPSVIEELAKMGLISEGFVLTGLGIPPEFRTV